jgi:hypothetical protein
MIIIIKFYEICVYI